jgi:hypothetical protein
MASNKDKAFALFYAVATVTATAIIAVIATNQPSRHRKHSKLGIT